MLLHIDLYELFIYCVSLFFFFFLLFSLRASKKMKNIRILFWFFRLWLLSFGGPCLSFFLSALKYDIRFRCSLLVSQSGGASHHRGYPHLLPLLGGLIVYADNHVFGQLQYTYIPSCVNIDIMWFRRFEDSRVGMV
ncbi:hypothetical protein DFH27DRAFT_194618 [Peziza echinospora]|nr:hypothetical protein DFH27DRAFT_194618 [Peziza echinospora]